MNKLSPAAQAVLSAWAKPVDVDRSLVINGKALEFQARGALAAALRAAADQVAPEVYFSYTDHRDWDQGMEARNDAIREAILAIADELEALPDD